MTRPLGLAFVGCGAVTERHSRTLRAMRALVHMHYASRDPAKAEAVRARFGGVRAYGSYEAAWSSPDVDAVLLATPPRLHLELALAALDAGKHVVVEKPAFPATEDFVKVREASARAGKQVLVAENYVYKPLAAVLRRVLERGDVGEPLLLLVDAVKRQRPEGWRADRVLSGGGGLLEGGIHWVSFMANLGLEPKDAWGHRAGSPPGDAPEGSSGPGRAATEETLVAVFEYEGGVVGTLSFSWEVPSPMKGVRISRIYGREGTARFESNGLFVLVRGRRSALHLPGIRDLSGHRAMFHDFLEAIRIGREPLMTLDLAERDIRLVNRIYASMEARP